MTLNKDKVETNKLKFKIHFDDGLGKDDDYYIVEGDTIEECRIETDKERNKMGLSVSACWSELIEGELEPNKKERE